MNRIRGIHTFSQNSGTRLLLAGLTLILAIGSAGVLTNISRAAATTMQLNFVLSTSSQAALGATLGFSITGTNTATTTQKAALKVDLIAPNGTLYNVYNSKVQSYNAGQTRSKSQTFLTTTYTSQTGTFTLNGYVTDGSGNVLVLQAFALTVIAVPANGIFASVGGVGPGTQLTGTPYVFQTVTSNLTSGSTGLRTIVDLIYPDSTVQQISDTGVVTRSANSNTVAAGTVTTSQYTTETGAFGAEVLVLDSNGNTLASQTQSFNRNALPADYYAPTFTDEAASSGVGVADQLVQVACSTGFSGAGAAVGDYDGDGLPDVFAVDQVVPSHLWHNNGNGTFTDMAAAAGIPVIKNASAANFVDYDNDGYPDVFISVANGQNVLLHNNGNGTFTDVTASSGLQTSVNEYFIGASWGDYDNDGYLDLYVGSHGDCSGNNRNAHLFHNNGNGTFTDVTSLLVSTTPGVNAKNLVSVWFDYNQDGRVDLYIGNDIGGKFGPNVLWRNDGFNATTGQWQFTDVSSATGTGLAMSAMGIAVGDYNRDGLFDMYATNVGNNKLLRQNPGGTFTEVGVASNAGRGSVPLGNSTQTNVGWGTAFYDFNNDGWEDLYMAAATLGGTSATPQPDAFLLNNRDGTFLDLSLLSGAAALGPSHTAVFADFNGDGFMDIFVTKLGTVPNLFINNARSNGNPYNYLRVKLIGTTSNRDAVGARLVASVGGVQLYRTIINGGTFQGNSELTAHIGLGSATQADSLTIYWPSGLVTTLNNVAANQLLTVTEP